MTLDKCFLLLFFLALWCALMIRGAVRMPGVARGHQRAAGGYKRPAWSSVCSEHHLSLRAAGVKEEISASLSSHSGVHFVSFSWNGSPHSLHLCFWNGFFCPGPQISHGTREQFGIQKSVNRSSQRIPSVHDPAVSLLQKCWFLLICSCQRCYCTKRQPVSAQFWFCQKPDGQRWVNSWIMFFMLLIGC